jgi:hypothetical protein
MMIDLLGTLWRKLRNSGWNAERASGASERSLFVYAQMHSGVSRTKNLIL